MTSRKMFLSAVVLTAFLGGAVPVAVAWACGPQGGWGDGPMMGPDGAPPPCGPCGGPGEQAGRGGPGGPGGAPGHWQREKPLTVEQVHDILAGRIAWRGEDLKVGKVVKVDDKTITAEILNPDGSVAHKVDVDPMSGRFRPQPPPQPKK